jgi:hypothetical protein
MDVLYIANSNVVEISALTNGQTSALISGATVGVTLTNATGTAVTATGVTWPVTLSAVSGATGTYRATLAHTIGLTTGATYYCDITADGGTDLQGAWHVPLRAVRRS